MRKGRTKNHALNGVPGGEGWSCDCGQAGDTAEDARTHHAKASTAAVKRLDDGNLRALLTIYATRGAEREAVHMLVGFAHNGRFTIGELRPYLRPGYDGYGCLQVTMNWQKLAKAVDSGTLAKDLLRESDDIVLVRFALSLLGHGAVNLAFLANSIYSKGDRETVIRALACVFPTDLDW